MCSSVGGLFVTTLGTTQTPVWRAGESSPVQAMPRSSRMLGYSGGRATKESRYGNIPGGEYGMDDVECKVGHISPTHFPRVMRIPCPTALTPHMMIVVQKRRPESFVGKKVSSAMQIYEEIAI